MYEMQIASLLAARAAWSTGVRRFADSSGASLLEYAIVMGMVSVAAFAALTLLGHTAVTSLSNAANSISS